MKTLDQIRAGLARNRATLLSDEGPSLRTVLHLDQVKLLVIATTLHGWEHVSVSVFSDHGRRDYYRCVTWEELDFIKNFFWPQDETVMQLHVPPAQAFGDPRACLHLWRPVEGGIPVPPPPVVELFQQYDRAQTRK